MRTLKIMPFILLLITLLTLTSFVVISEENTINFEIKHLPSDIHDEFVVDVYANISSVYDSWLIDICGNAKIEPVEVVVSDVWSDTDFYYNGSIENGSVFDIQAFKMIPENGTTKLFSISYIIKEYGNITLSLCKYQSAFEGEFIPLETSDVSFFIEENEDLTNFGTQGNLLLITIIIIACIGIILYKFLMIKKNNKDDDEGK